MSLVDRTGRSSSRRRFLQLGAVAALAISGALLARLGRRTGLHEASTAERPVALSRQELAVVAAFARRVIAPAHGGPSVSEAQIARRIERELAIVGGRLAVDVRAALRLIEYGPWLDLHFLRFTKLGAQAQDEFLRACEISRWLPRRQAYAGLRLLCLFFYTSDDRSWPSIGYAGPTVARKLPEASNAIAALGRSLGAGNP